MSKFKGIREAEQTLISLLTTKGYREGILRPSTQKKLDELIDFCAAYQSHQLAKQLAKALKEKTNA
jgi:hypothetical protein